MTLKIYNFFLPFFFIFIIGMLMIPYYFIEEGIKIIFAQALIIAVLEWIVFSSILLAIKITHYILILVLVSFLIPFTNAQLIPETLTIQHILLAFPLISIHPDREFLISRTLMLSYTLILFYLIEYLIYAFLIIAYPSLIFMRKKSEVKHSVPTHVSKLCEKISKELGIRIPRIVFLKTPEIFTFGNDDKNAVITIYERCAELSEDEIEPILIHEMAHIKFDVSHHSFHYLLARFHGKFSILTVLPFLCVAIWFILNFLSILEAPVTSVEQAIHWIIDLIPFMTAFLSFIEIMFFNSSVTQGMILMNPSFEIGEFRADLITFLKVGGERLINSLNSWRKIQIKYYMENPSLESPKFSKLKGIYTKIFGKIGFSKEYSSWLEYFRESIGRLMISERGFSPPMDKLRKDFINFLKKIVDESVSFQKVKKEIEIGTILWKLKKSFSGSEIGLYEFDKDFRRISSDERRKIIEYLINNLEDFNAKFCSLVTNVDLYKVIVIVVMLLVDGSLSLKYD